MDSNISSYVINPLTEREITTNNPPYHEFLQQEYFLWNGELISGEESLNTRENLNSTESALNMDSINSMENIVPWSVDIAEESCSYPIFECVKCGKDTPDKTRHCVNCNPTDDYHTFIRSKDDSRWSLTRLKIRNDKGRRIWISLGLYWVKQKHNHVCDTMKCFYSVNIPSLVEEHSGSQSKDIILSWLNSYQTGGIILYHRVFNPLSGRKINVGGKVYLELTTHGYIHTREEDGCVLINPGNFSHGYWSSVFMHEKIKTILGRKPEENEIPSFCSHSVDEYKITKTFVIEEDLYSDLFDRYVRTIKRYLFAGGSTSDGVVIKLTRFATVRDKYNFAMNDKNTTEIDTNSGEHAFGLISDSNIILSSIWSNLTSRMSVTIINQPFKNTKDIEDPITGMMISTNDSRYMYLLSKGFALVDINEHTYAGEILLPFDQLDQNMVVLDKWPFDIEYDEDWYRINYAYIKKKSAELTHDITNNMVFLF